VLTIDPGTDGIVQVGIDNSGVTVINTTSRAIVVVDLAHTDRRLISERAGGGGRGEANR
jgi:hypothetical protein